jgi:hypothetical protein
LTIPIQNIDYGKEREKDDMKNWICYNLFGEHPDAVDTFGMVSGLGILAFLAFWTFYLLVYVPFLYFLGI